MGITQEDSSTSGFSFPKNLSVWWSEETEYVLQRIERWAACARGYNRLRSVRLSPGRMTMQEEPENRWSISRATNRLVVENSWSPSFRGRRKPQQQQQQEPSEQARLRCCALGNLDYKSNGNLGSNVLEEYSLDHSIYFKTIGEIRSELRPASKNETTTSDHNDSDNSNNNNNGPAKQPPLDCGDFLSSDFDELDDDEDVDLEELAAANYQLREQLAANCDCEDDTDSDSDSEHNSHGSGVIQVCRSVMDEDEINNNFAMLGYSRKFAAASTPPRALVATATVAQ